MVFLRVYFLYQPVFKYKVRWLDRLGVLISFGENLQ